MVLEKYWFFVITLLLDNFSALKFTVVNTIHLQMCLVLVCGGSFGIAADFALICLSTRDETSVIGPSSSQSIFTYIMSGFVVLVDSNTHLKYKRHIFETISQNY